MNKLENQRGIGTPDANYEFGKIIDGVTYFDAKVLNDMVYFLQKLVKGNVVGGANNLDENVTNGYQTIDALNRFVANRTMQTRGIVTAPDFTIADLTLFDNQTDYDNPDDFLPDCRGTRCPQIP